MRTEIRKIKKEIKKNRRKEKKKTARFGFSLDRITLNSPYPLRYNWIDECTNRRFKVLISATFRFLHQYLFGPLRFERAFSIRNIFLVVRSKVKWWRHWYCLFSLRCHFSQSTKRITRDSKQPISNEIWCIAWKILHTLLYLSFTRVLYSAVGTWPTVGLFFIRFSLIRSFVSMIIIFFFFVVFFFLDLNTILTGLIDPKPVQRAKTLR